MRRPTSLATLAALALITACSEQTPAIPTDVSGVEFLTHTKRLDLGAAQLRSHTPHQGLSGAQLVAPPDYAQLDDAAARGSGGSLHLTVNTAGDIPRHPDAFIQSVAVFGYAWADLATGQGIVAVIHPAIGRDSRQNPDGWHTHPVQLAAGTAASDFCVVSIGRSQAGIAIQDDLMRTNIALQWAGINPGALDVAAAFVVQPDAACSGSGLGVLLLDAEAL
jgi:hypothetical protein